MALRKKIIIAGRAASGKTTLKDELVRQWGLKPEISYTTRHIREGEVDGIDYNFVSKLVFEQMIKDGKMLQYDNFNGNYYGTTLEEFNATDVMISTPQGIKNASRVREAMFVISLYTPQAIIMNRLTARHKVTSKDQMTAIRERVAADNLQFNEFESSPRNYDIQIDSSKPLSLMLAQIKKYENQYR